MKLHAELFAGVRSWDQVMPAGALPGSQTLGIQFEQPRAVQSLAQLAGPQQQMRLQSLKNVWSDYTQVCVCVCACIYSTLACV